MKKYEITCLDSGKTEIMTKGEANKAFGRVEFLEMIQGYLPNYLVAEIENQ